MQLLLLLIVWYEQIYCLGKKSIDLIMHRQNDGSNLDAKNSVTVVSSDILSVEGDKLWIQSQEVGNQLFYTYH